MKELKNLIEQYEIAIALGTKKEGDIQSIAQELEIKNQFIDKVKKISEIENKKDSFNNELDKILKSKDLVPASKNAILCLKGISQSVFDYLANENDRLFKEKAKKIEEIQKEYIAKEMVSDCNCRFYRDNFGVAQRENNQNCKHHKD